jgi:hypothetical protein
VSWEGVEGVNYFLERSTDLGATPSFTPLARHLPGQSGTNVFTDSKVAEVSGVFYRVGVEE